MKFCYTLTFSNEKNNLFLHLNIKGFNFSEWNGTLLSNLIPKYKGCYFVHTFIDIRMSINHYGLRMSINHYGFLIIFTHGRVNTMMSRQDEDSWSSRTGNSYEMGYEGSNSGWLVITWGVVMARERMSLQ